MIVRACTTMRFVDTNVLLYAISTDPAEQRKRGIAERLLADRELALSTQVLQEFYVQATRVTREDRLSHEQAAALVTAFGRYSVQATSVELVHAAMNICERYGLSYWDAAIVAAAGMLDCTELLSEDLSHGQSFDGLIVVDPFR